MHKKKYYPGLKSSIDCNRKVVGISLELTSTDKKKKRRNYRI